MSSVHEELIKLANDLYQQGYHAGIKDEKWIEAYASAMYLISNCNSKFSDDLLTKIYEGKL